MDKKDQPFLGGKRKPGGGSFWGKFKGGGSEASGWNLLKTAKAGTGGGGTKQAGGDRFARAGAAATPKAPEQSKKMSKPSPAKTYAMDKAPRRKPVTGVSSGNINKPNNKSAQKSRDELGAFYLNATSGMDIHSKPGQKRK